MCFRKSESNLYLGPAEPQKANSYRYQFTYTLRKGIELTPARADGTARAAWWESRSLPGFILSIRGHGDFRDAGHLPRSGAIFGSSHEGGPLETGARVEYRYVSPRFLSGQPLFASKG
jgi:hypothetical protein